MVPIDHLLERMHPSTASEALCGIEVSYGLIFRAGNLVSGCGVVMDGILAAAEKDVLTADLPEHLAKANISVKLNNSPVATTHVKG